MSFREFFARAAGLFSGRPSDDDARAEMESHVEMETAENVRRGMSPEDARRAALLSAGGVTQAIEAVHDQRGLPWIEGIVSDIKYAFRSLRYSRGFAITVIVTLALGIGANTAIFTVLRGVLLKPLPHRDGDRLLSLQQNIDGPNGNDIKFSVPEVRDLREGAPSLSGGIAEYSAWQAVLMLRDEPIRVDVGLTTGNFFQVMGLAPVLGHLTSPLDDGPGKPQVIVLSHAFWMQKYGGDHGIVGTVVPLNGEPATIIGVLQQAPFFPGKVDIFTNMVVSSHHLSAQMVESRGHRMTEVVARLGPDATLQQARVEIDGVYARLRNQFKENYNPELHYRVEAVTLKQALGERAQLTMYLLMAAAAFVMIISAANVANLTLMRGVRREHELVVRAALGAGVKRLRRLLLVENLMLTVAGAVVGAVIASFGVELLVAVAERYSTRASEIQLDYVVLGFALSLAVAMALLMSFVATLPRDGALGSLVAGARRMTGGLRKQRLQRALVVAQVAVSVVLLAGAGLLTRTLIRLYDIDTGLKTEDVITVPVQLRDPSRGSPAEDAYAKRVYGEMRDAMAALPGVKEAGLGSTMPLRTSFTLEIQVEGKTRTDGEAPWNADIRMADPNYFGASGIPLLQGRPFQLSDLPTSEKVAIVNQLFVDKFFPGENVIGRRMKWGSPGGRATPFGDGWRTIVGVVGTTLDGGPEAKPRLAVFMPFAQEFTLSSGIVLRTDGDAANIAAAATRIVRRMAPTIPVDPPQTITQYRAEQVAPRRLNALLVSSFGVLALIIAGVGIGGVLAFSVGSRTNEIGVRMSLGAGQGAVQRMILWEGGVLVIAGLALGVGGAFVAGRAMRGFLWGVQPNDPITLLAVAALMAVIGLVACWAPAVRASRIDPAITMRAS